MAGNVWEWTNSTYCPYDDPGCSKTQRVYRGGCWGVDTASYMRGAFRISNAPSGRGSDLGFRCSRG